MLLRIAAGITTGAIALCFAQPTDLVKIRMQSTRGRYDNFLHAYRTIIRDEGVRGLWKGRSVFLLTGRFIGPKIFNFHAVITSSTTWNESRNYFYDLISFRFVSIQICLMVAWHRAVA